MSDDVPDSESSQEETPILGPITRRQFTVGGVTLGAAALLGLKVTPVADAGQGQAGVIIPTPYFHERVHQVPPYDPNGTCVVILGPGGGPDAYYSHGVSAAVWCRGSIYLLDFGIGMHRQFMFARLAPKLIRAAFVTHFHSDHIAGAYPFFSENYYYFYQPYTDTTPTIKMIGPPSAATNAPPGSNGLPPGGSFIVNPANPTPGMRDFMRLWVEGPYAYDNNIRAIEEGMPDLLGLYGGAPLLEPVEVPLPAQANFENRAPDMDPVQVYEDDKVKVSAILVSHGPVFPALAYRFDTPDGSITFSGDTSADPNLIKLAHRTDILVHEVLYVGWLQWLVSVRGYPEKLFKHLALAHTMDRSVSLPEIGLQVDGVGKVAADAQAKQLVLYHLSPTMEIDEQGRQFDIQPTEWDKYPRQEFGRNVYVGKDLLRVNL